MSNHTTTVAGYLLRRLADAGVRSVFGTAGDGDVVLWDALASHPELTWIETATEQAASGAAGGYARLRGLGATLTSTPPPRTMATPAPVVHIVPAPPSGLQHAGPSGLRPGAADGAPAKLRAETAAAEIDRILAVALRGASPAWLSVPADVAVSPVPAPAAPLAVGRPDIGPLSWATLWAAVQGFLAPGDVLVTDQGALDGAASLVLPDGAQLIAASYPAPSGWTGPAALGASLAAPEHRVVVLSGDRGPARAAGLSAVAAQGLAPVMIWAGHDATPVPAPAGTGAAAVTTRVTSRPALTAALAEASRHAAAGRLVLIQAVFAT